MQIAERSLLAAFSESKFQIFFSRSTLYITLWLDWLHYSVLSPPGTCAFKTKTLTYLFLHMPLFHLKWINLVWLMAQLSSEINVSLSTGCRNLDLSCLNVLQGWGCKHSITDHGFSWFKLLKLFWTLASQVESPLSKKLKFSSECSGSNCSLLNY